jgi:hypothetical protein
MKFLFADSMDFIDPDYDFAADRMSHDRRHHRDDEYPHEYLERPPYDGVLVSRGIVGDARLQGKYNHPQMMRFRREGARKFLRYPESRFPGSLLFGDNGAFTYRNMDIPPYTAIDTVEFYADGGFTHGCSVDHVILDFDEAPGRTRDQVSDDTRRRYDLTLALAADFWREARHLGRRFTPLGVVQGWSAASMAWAARQLAHMGYSYLAVGGLVPLKMAQIHQALAAIRDAVPPRVKLHLLGFGKIEDITELSPYGVASFDTTSPLLRAFKDAKKNYFVRTPSGELDYYTAIRIPQATENNRLLRKARSGSLHQESSRQLEAEALAGMRGFDAGNLAIEQALDAVMTYWAKLNWNEELSETSRLQRLAIQRNVYRRTLIDRPWQKCPCRVCRESGVEAVIFRNSNRNKRRGFHNLYVFHNHLTEQRTAA